MVFVVSGAVGRTCEAAVPLASGRQVQGAPESYLLGFGHVLGAKQCLCLYEPERKKLGRLRGRRAVRRNGVVQWRIRRVSPR